ncbi:hypothetical protein LC55x_3093 [Lysobacter capsici]|nr:hypothetical protein LC55x_3093 [Lysobacter capsici]
MRLVESDEVVFRGRGSCSKEVQQDAAPTGRPCRFGSCLK